MGRKTTVLIRAGLRRDAIPRGPGVYIFKMNHQPLYVGKAANLHTRVASYFRASTSRKTRELLQRATRLEWIETAAEIEALVQEARLIKKYQPPFNVVMRSDINYFFVAVTREEFPRIYVTHESATSSADSKNIGPFTSGRELKVALRLLRRIFPYCTCKTVHTRPCLNTQIQRCPGICCMRTYGQVPKLKSYEYQQNIKNIVAILNGKSTALMAVLARMMRRASADKNFERAAILRDELAGVKNIFAHRRTLASAPVLKNEMRWHKIERILRALLARERISRVEGYDISNISGTAATGSMSVFINGAPVKSAYRKFKIKTVSGSNDVEMLQEVLRRRIAHHEWRYPELILIDGGKPQLNAAFRALRSTKASPGIALAALAKKEEELYLSEKAAPIRLRALPRPVMHFLQRVRDESHRFAKKYHSY